MKVILSSMLDFLVIPHLTCQQSSKPKNFQNRRILIQSLGRAAGRYDGLVVDTFQCLCAPADVMCFSLLVQDTSFVVLAQWYHGAWAAEQGEFGVFVVIVGVEDQRNRLSVDDDVLSDRLNQQTGVFTVQGVRIIT